MDDPTFKHATNRRMNTKKTDALTAAAELVDNLEPMLKCAIAQAKHHGLDEIRVSTAVARELHLMTIILEKRLKEIFTTASAADKTIDRHLDRIFSL